MIYELKLQLLQLLGWHVRFALRALFAGSRLRQSQIDYTFHRS